MHGRRGGEGKRSEMMLVCQGQRVKMPFAFAEKTLIWHFIRAKAMCQAQACAGYVFQKNKKI